MAVKKSIAKEVIGEEVELKDRKLVLENKPAPYHVMVRYLSGVDVPDKNMFTSATVEEHIKTWTDLGYEIAFSNHIGRQRDEETGTIAECIYFLFKYAG